MKTVSERYVGPILISIFLVAVLTITLGASFTYSDAVRRAAQSDIETRETLARIADARERRDDAYRARYRDLIVAGFGAILQAAGVPFGGSPWHHAMDKFLTHYDQNGVHDHDIEAFTVIVLRDARREMREEAF